MRLEGLTVDHVNPLREEALYVISDPHVIEYSHLGAGVELDQTLTSLSGRLSPRASEPKSATWATPRKSLSTRRNVLRASSRVMLQI